MKTVQSTKYVNDYILADQGKYLTGTYFSFPTWLLPTKRVPGPLSPETEQPECKNEHSPPHNAGVKNVRSTTYRLPPYIFKG